jgi:hypothetical protein
MCTKLSHPIIIIVEGDKIKYAHTYFYMPFSNTLKEEQNWSMSITKEPLVMDLIAFHPMVKDVY